MSSNGHEAPPTGARLNEPIRKPMVWAGLIALILVGIPWYLPEGTLDPIVVGLPLWTLVAMASSVGVAAYLSWMVKRHWDVVESYEEAQGEAIGPDSDIDDVERRCSSWTH